MNRNDKHLLPLYICFPEYSRSKKKLSERPNEDYKMKSKCAHIEYNN